MADLDESEVYEGGLDAEKSEIKTDSATKLKEGSSLKSSQSIRLPTHEANIV